MGFICYSVNFNALEKVIKLETKLTEALGRLFFKNKF